MDIWLELGCLFIGMAAMGIVWFISDNGKNSPYSRGFNDGYKIAKMECGDGKRKKGHWIKTMETKQTTKYSSYNPRWYCSCCNTEYDPAIANEINYCWKCGADMRGDSNGEE